ncbi:iron-containing redox enzyme family protein [Arsukibacterium perlucidum]|uniref:iron-containing redox enzyme family protein n=1 Tax=Arsukibacterium perlucidum TaxID=368811 RepID=UPI001969F500|nr:iron-containing redox enzyme family protein [Arsukibacterium perlucidum]
MIEGSRWISRCASSFDRDYSDVRSVIIGHAREEHRDYEMLEQDYVAAGGSLADIQHAARNIGTEALHGFLMYRASQSNPVDLVGAMWIIEGLGQKMASDWAAQIDKTTGGDGSYSRFMRYHGANDDDHLQKLYQLLDRLCQSPSQLDAIVRTARVTARLYCLQLEEVDNEY